MEKSCLSIIIDSRDCGYRLEKLPIPGIGIYRFIPGYENPGYDG